MNEKEKFSTQSIVVDGFLRKCNLVGSDPNGYYKVNLYTDNVPVSQHQIPASLFISGGKVTTGGHTYEAVRR